MYVEAGHVSDAHQLTPEGTVVRSGSAGLASTAYLTGSCPGERSQEVGNGAASAARSSRPRHNRLPVRARASSPAAAAFAARSG